MEIISVFILNDTIKLKRNINGKVDYLKSDKSVYDALEQLLTNKKISNIIVSYDNDIAKINYENGLVLELNNFEKIAASFSILETKKNIASYNKTFWDEIITGISLQNIKDSDAKVTRKNTIGVRAVLSISAAALIAYVSASQIPNFNRDYDNAIASLIALDASAVTKLKIETPTTTQTTESVTLVEPQTTLPQTITEKETTTKEPTTQETSAAFTTQKVTEESSITTTHKPVNVDNQKIYYCTDAYGKKYEFYIAKSGKSYNYTQSDVNHLAIALYHESRGENKVITFFVGTVILNRVNSNEFPNTIDGVLSQRGQYSWYPSRGFSTSNFSEPRAYEDCQEIARQLLEGYVIYDASTEEPFLPNNALYQAGFVQGDICYAADTGYGNEYFCR